MSPQDGLRPPQQATAIDANPVQRSRVAGWARARRLRARAAVYGLASLATLGLAATSAAHLGGGLGDSSEAIWDRPARAAGDAQASTGRLQPANSGGGFFSFLEGLFGIAPPRGAPRPSYRREAPWPQRLPPQKVSPPPPASPPEVATYRTMCVRLCDGYYWPVSFATSKDNFGRDEQVCLNSCSATAALYAYPNPGGGVEEMVSLQGKSYKSLATAFLYRTVYDPGCKCRPHPWEAAAIERHKGYAAQSPPRAVAHGTRSRR